MSARVVVLFPERILVRAGRWSGVRCTISHWFMPLALEDEVTPELRARVESAIARCEARHPGHRLELCTMEIPVDHHRTVDG